MTKLAGSSLMDAMSRGISWFLRFDPETLDALSKLDGRVIAIEVLGIDEVIFVMPQRQGVVLQGACASSPDVRITGKLIDLLSLTRQQEVTHSGAVNITGDLAVAREFETLLKNLNIDWEEAVSPATGDFLAHKLGNAARRLRAWARGSRTSFEEDVSEFLRYERRLVPQPGELDQFLGAIDRLRDDVERLEQRVGRMDKPVSSQYEP